MISAIKPNAEQSFILEESYNWFYHSDEPVFQISGGPGTGKSTLLNMIVDNLCIPRSKVMPMSYMGSASLNMRRKGFGNAKTFHSWMMSPTSVKRTDKNGLVIMNDYLNRPKLTMGFSKKSIDGDYLLIILDEGGSLPLEYRPIIESHNIKILVAGDVDQLPPVKSTPAYLYSGKVYKLTQIMRQDGYSNIPILSQRALKGLPIQNGYYGDVLVIDYDQLTDEMIAGSDVVICGKNKTRDIINDRVRKNILGFKSTLPSYGERLICRRNNWLIECDGINLVNGLTGSVTNFPDVSCFDGKTFRIDFMPDLGYVPFTNIPVDHAYLNSPYEERERLKNRDYYNGELFEYAYAITTHSSQGSEYNNGIYIEEFLDPSIQNNLNYVGISRFRQSLIYVKSPFRKIS